MRCLLGTHSLIPIVSCTIGLTLFFASPLPGEEIDSSLIRDDRSATVRPIPTTHPESRAELIPTEIPDRRVIRNTESTAHAMTFAELKRVPVVDSNSVAIGHIIDLVVDVNTADIRYAAVALGKADRSRKFLAVPFGSLSQISVANCKALQIDRDADSLRDAPGFPRDRWPNFGNRRWAECIDVYFGVAIREDDLRSQFGTAVQPLRSVKNVVRLSLLHNCAGIDSDGLDVTPVEAFRIDIEHGIVRELAMQHDVPASDSE